MAAFNIGIASSASFGRLFFNIEIDVCCRPVLGDVLAIQFHFKSGDASPFQIANRLCSFRDRVCCSF
jgi:hypothetical protein